MQSFCSPASPAVRWFSVWSFLVQEGLLLPVGGENVSRVLKKFPRCDVEERRIVEMLGAFGEVETAVSDQIGLSCAEVSIASDDA